MSRLLALALLLVAFINHASAQDFLIDDKQSGCCSSHGGVGGGCQSNGHVICVDGWRGSTCQCTPVVLPIPTQRPIPTVVPTSIPIRPTPKGSNNGGNIGAVFDRLIGTYRGILKIKKSSSNDPLYLPPQIGSKVTYSVVMSRKINSTKFYLTLKKPFLRRLSVSKIKTDSFTATSTYLINTFADRGFICEETFTLKFSKVSGSTANVQALQRIVCDSGYITEISLQGVLRRSF